MYTQFCSDDYPSVRTKTAIIASVPVQNYKMPRHPPPPGCVTDLVIVIESRFLITYGLIFNKFMFQLYDLETL